jgi:hypothetical protein
MSVAPHLPVARKDARAYLWARTGPILLGDADAEDEASEATAAAWKELPRHRDEDQVQLDVNRSFVYYPSSM